MASRPAAGSGPSIALGLVALALLLFVLAVLYALGVVNVLAFHGAGPHYKHAVLLAILGIASLVAANFVRRRQTV
jgi:hypothetical protein